MHRKLYHNAIIGVLTVNLFIGCNNISPQVKMREVKSLIKKEDKAVISVVSKDKYEEKEAIKFKIDTGNTKGYLYVLYLDKKGEAEVLYPQKDTKAKKQGGKLLFPNDFDNINVQASKDCKSCEKEKTTVYVLLSDEPILEIDSLDKNELLGLNSKPIKSRALILGNSVNSKIYIKKIEFFVE